MAMLVSTPDRRQFTILLVEDDADTYELYSDVLAGAGFSVVGADSGDDVLHKALQHSPDLVVMDYQLKGMNGGEAMSLLKQDARTANVPVVMLTAQFARRNAEEMRARGCDAFLSKPCSMDSLLSEVRRLLERGNEQHPVLIVEDDDEIRESIAQLLAMEGLAVHEASNGRDALAWLRQCESLPRLVLLDLMMPVMDGWSFRTAQLADARLAQIPVIILSATTDVQREAGSLRVDEFLSKPLDVRELLNAVEKHV
jgi:CheY-like chemotaxis protein